MEGLATALGGIISLDKFMTALTALVPVIGGLLIFSFIFNRVKRITKSAAKGKASI